MLCYSWDKLDYISRNKIGIEESMDIQNLLCRILVDEVDILIKKGIKKNYKELKHDGCHVHTRRRWGSSSGRCR